MPSAAMTTVLPTWAMAGSEKVVPRSDRGDGLGVPAAGAVRLPVQVQAVEDALGRDDDGVADLGDGRVGEGRAVRGDLLAVPVVSAELVPVEPQPVSGGVYGDHRVAAGHRDRRIEDRKRQRG